MPETQPSTARPIPPRVHLIGICGTGMGSLARLFKSAGSQVRGSDAAALPPMSLQLSAAGIEVLQGYEARHLAWNPELVVVGNIARRDNAEAMEAENRGLPRLSMAAAISRFFLAGRHPVVVSGTHGKTTTASLIAWALEAAGRSPGFLVGGVLENFQATSQQGSGAPFVLEGDEYESAFFEHGPKFLQYQPRTAILTSVELDHVELFANLEAVKAAFRKFVALLPGDGRLIACGDDPNVVEVAAACSAPVTFYGLSEAADCRARMLEQTVQEMHFEIFRHQKLLGRFRSPLAGRHNLKNLAACVETLCHMGVGPADIGDGLARFKGVKRRQEIRGVAAGITVMDDFAHHPTAVRETLKALKSRFQGQRLVAVFEPRTNSSRRSLFQEAYTDALQEADQVMVCEVYQAERLPSGQRLDPRAICKELEKRGTPAAYGATPEAILRHLLQETRAGDLVVIMSNGAFGDLQAKLLASLSSRERGARPSAPPEDGLIDRR